MSHGRPRYDMLLLLMVATISQAAAQHGFRIETSNTKHLTRVWSRSRHRTRRVLEETSTSSIDASSNTKAPVDFTLLDDLAKYTVNYTLNNLRGTEISSSLVFVRMDELKEQCRDMAKRAALGGGKKVLIVPTIHWSGNEQKTESWCYRTGAWASASQAARLKAYRDMEHQPAIVPQAHHLHSISASTHPFTPPLTPTHASGQDYQCKAVTDEAIKQFSDDVAACAQAAIDAGFREIHLLPHNDIKGRPPQQ